MVPDPNTPIALSGAPGSPYTRKMLALLRYRRIAYRFLPPSGAAIAGLPSPKVALLPTFYLPDEAGQIAPVTDSTPIIRRLEAERAGRSVRPDDPVLAFIDDLLEDYADEWLTKAMFHYRWAFEADAAHAARILPCWRGMQVADEELALRGAAFRERQVGRLYVVGSNALTAPVIEASYERFLDLMEAHLRERPFLLGTRPAASDFAVFGQLTQLALFDPTPMALTGARAPRVFAWTCAMEDLSGHEPEPQGWEDVSSPPATLRALLAEMGRVYAPVMAANAEAHARGASEFTTQVGGLAWRQPVFPYQAKCLGWLRQVHAALGQEHQHRLAPWLDGSGLECLFAAP